MTSRLRETAPVLAGVAGGLIVLGGAVAVLVTSPGLDRFLPPVPTATPTPAAIASASPSVGPSPSSSASGEVGLRPGDLAPPLEVDGLDGKPLNLAALRGQVVWLNFMGSWCPPCYDELPDMQRYWLRLKGKGIVIVGVDVKESKEQAQAFVKLTGVTFPVGVDPTSTTEDYWATFVLPVHFWIDKDGIVRGFAFGGIGPAQMETGLSSVLPALFPTPAPSGPPIGEPGPSASASALPSP